MSKILYTVATDKNGNLIKATDAEKGNEFFCPICKSDLILRKSGNTGKGSKRPHFAHRTLTPNCTPETALHYSFKNLLAAKIQVCLDTQTPLPIDWHCTFCGTGHSGNLLKKVRSVKVEHNLKVCQPDICMFDAEGKPFAVVEVVVTHEPEKEVVSFYSNNDIILIRIDVTSDEDIDKLEERITKPNFVGTCFNPKCKTCGRWQQTKIMTIVDGPCYKCDSTMKVATIAASKGLINGASNIAPSEFSYDEFQFAQSKGVVLNVHYSKTVNEKYIANTCTGCGAFAGNHYLFTQYIAPASYGSLPSEQFTIGFYCEYCQG